ncbi:hypothetical protein [uncultured Phenylobacterium sp.]|uniref:hypothetical protein n=1 Tax=uncultured Phenylobacterium sp. TaxID=349273 RepID=UPI0025E09181|nr:hypothetical protein [uncultured Phenylobacterium sp.]
MTENATRSDAYHLEMIEAMTRCAFELGSAAGEIAKRAGDDLARFLAATDEFRRCFFAVRMGIRLAQALRAGTLTPRVTAPAEPLERERREAPDWPERDEAPERLEVEREREGDYEPVSLAQFLKTLRGVAASAEQHHREDLPAHVRDTALPNLRQLLRRAEAPSGEPPARAAASVMATLLRPTAAPAARSRLMTSTVTLGAPPIRLAPFRRRDSG